MSRLSKLKILADKQASKKALEEENRQQFLNAIDTKKEQLDEALSKDVEVNAESIIEALKPVADTIPVVQELVTAITDFKVQDKDILKALSTIADLLKTNSKKAPVVIEKTSEVDITPITKELSKVVANTKAKATSQSPEDYIPYRRVRKDGNRLVFDDSYYNSGGGGGGGISQVTNPDGSQIGKLSGLINFEYDYVSQTQAALTDAWLFKTGGAGGTTLGTVTITYTDATKNIISTVELV